jgi:hypothetical protein
MRGRGFLEEELLQGEQKTTLRREKGEREATGEREGGWTQGFGIARRALYHLNHALSPFLFFSYFSDTVLCYCLGLAWTFVVGSELVLGSSDRGW